VRDMSKWTFGWPVIRPESVNIVRLPGLIVVGQPMSPSSGQPLVS
jgi:hypothetical protein